jgi:hypothetical protein
MINEGGKPEIRRKVMIIGAGGIGSYLVSFLNRVGIYDITVYDDDNVERKNLSTQNLHLDAIGEKKVESILLPIDNGTVQREAFPVLVEKQLHGYELVVCCADNLAIRRLVYRQGFGADCENKWLDLRSQGRNGAVISYLTDEKLMTTLLAGPEGSFSCQGENWDGSPEGINLTHIAIAGMASQWIQRWFEGGEENVADKMVVNI